MRLKAVLKTTITAILARHIAAAAEEIAAAMTDEIDALARDRFADLYPRLELAESTAESRANGDERTLRQQNNAAYLAAFRELASDGSHGDRLRQRVLSKRNTCLPPPKRKLKSGADLLLGDES